MLSSHLPAVVSWPRSGSHWLCSLIYQWFCWNTKGVEFTWKINVPFTNLEGPGTTCPWAQIFAGHIYHPQSELARELNRSGRKVIYLCRDYRHVLASMWRWERAASKRPEDVPPFKKYISDPPGGLAFRENGVWSSNRNNPIAPGLSVRQALAWSVKQWIKAEYCCVVRYEDLVTDPDMVRDALTEWLGLGARKLSHPADTHVGHLVGVGEYTTKLLWRGIV